MSTGGCIVGVSGIGVNISSLLDLFKVENMLSIYFLQLAVGIYIIEIIFILTTTLVTIDSGEDKLKQTYDIANNLLYGGLLYLIVALVSIIALSAIAGVALGSLAGTGG